MASRASRVSEMEVCMAEARSGNVDLEARSSSTYKDEEARI